jgi:hypothetical protein
MKIRNGERLERFDGLLDKPARLAANIAVGL